ncbi:hypothetical protein [Caulifigura coniformis]|nr:hypothetical protein [Caulifigura coniformis]
MSSDRRISSLHGLLWATVLGCHIFTAPATMPQHPSAVAYALGLGVWSLVVVVLGVRTIRQVELSKSGILAPVLVLLVAVQAVTFFAMAYWNVVRQWEGGSPGEFETRR